MNLLKAETMFDVVYNIAYIYIGLRCGMPTIYATNCSSVFSISFVVLCSSVSSSPIVSSCSRQC